jgi:hypothetical protein
MAATGSGSVVVFLSTSRGYPVASQVELKQEAETRFEIAAEQAVPGVSTAGSLSVPPRWRPHPLRRAAELLIEEYRESPGLGGSGASIACSG